MSMMFSQLHALVVYNIKGSVATLRAMTTPFYFEHLGPQVCMGSIIDLQPLLAIFANKYSFSKIWKEIKRRFFQIYK